MNIRSVKGGITEAPESAVVVRFQQVTKGSIFQAEELSRQRQRLAKKTPQ